MTARLLRSWGGAAALLVACGGDPIAGDGEAGGTAGVSSAASVAMESSEADHGSTDGATGGGASDSSGPSGADALDASSGTGSEDGSDDGPAEIQPCQDINLPLAEAERGLAFTLDIDLRQPGDTLDAPAQSSVALFEDGVAIGPAHSDHQAIRDGGGGRFSHWGNRLYFSSSDGSDPRSNGRVYSYGPCVDPWPIETTTVASIETVYGTFQSHNDRVVSIGDDLFLSYLTERTDTGPGHWVIAQSSDGGGVWNPIAEGTHGTNPPSLATDGLRVFAHHSAWDQGQTSHGHFLRFDAPFLSAAVNTTFPNGTGSKSTMCWDAFRSTAVVLTFWDELQANLFVLDDTGLVSSSVNLHTPGPNGAVQYPLCSVRGSDIVVAWTTDPVAGAPPFYRSIHFVMSQDGGASWIRGPWDTDPLALPIVADETGASTTVTLPDELNVNTWLSSVVLRDSTAHFLYRARGDLERQHLVTFDLGSGQRVRDRWPRVFGNALGLASTDGFFVDDPDSGRLYVVAAGEDGRLTMLGSDDNGTTWFDAAVGPELEPGHILYAVSGSRRPTPDGRIVGAYTDVDTTGATPNQVVFFSVSPLRD